uniref:Uncharacterized protein n=1 Tax=Cronobacter phage CSP1 TaxID=1983560 RepID=A0AB33C553_9CAUD
MARKYSLTRAQHALLLQVMRMKYEKTTWAQAMQTGREFYAQLIAQNA